MDKILVPTQLRDESTRLLLRAKMILSHAVEHGSKSSEFDNSLAILGLDNCIEYTLRIIAIHFELETLTGKSFDIPDLPSLAGEIYKTIKDSTGIKLPYLAEIKLLRQTRNLVQHGMVSPKADMDRFIKITERFFDNVLLQLFGLNKYELKLSVVVEDSQVKGFFQKAEDLIDQKDWLLSIVASRDAFENSYYNKIKHASVSLLLYPALIYAKEKNDLTYHSWVVLIKELLLNYLGINTPEYRRFLEFMRHIPKEHRPSKGCIGNCVMQREWNREDALFCYSFAVNTVLMWQSREKEEVYKTNFEDNKTLKRKIGNMTIPEETEEGCYYFEPSDVMIELMYGNSNLIEKLQKLKINNIYKLQNDLIDNGEKMKSSHISTQIKFLGLHCFLLVNNPEKWCIIIWYELLEDIKK